MLLKVLRPEEGIPEASQGKPEKGIVGEVRSKLSVMRTSPLVHRSALAPSLRHLVRGCEKASLCEMAWN